MPSGRGCYSCLYLNTYYYRYPPNTRSEGYPNYRSKGWPNYNSEGYGSYNSEGWPNPGQPN